MEKEPQGHLASRLPDDEDGRAVRADVYRWGPTPWQRFWAWLGF
jgi:hypothetical protein